jgi:photosystem II stability/assembly factor-like uncharacterized protein
MLRLACVVSLLVLAGLGCVQAQWTMQTSNSTADLRGIHSVGNGVAWASGTNGTVLRTEDGGYVWQSCSIPLGAEHLDFRGVQAFDANTAIVMSSGKGDLSKLYKTTDGCLSWTLVFPNPDSPDGFFDSFYIHSTGHGILLGDPVDNRFALFETSDGGKTWDRDKRDGLVINGKPIDAFAASNSLFVQSSSGYMRGFATGGPGGAFLFEAWTHRDWTRTPIPVETGSESSGVFSLGYRFTVPRCVDCENPSDYFLVAVGGDYTKPDESLGTAAWSTNLGKTWERSTSTPHGYRSSVAYDSATKTWITVGPNGTDISTDDGKNWRPLHPNAGLHEAPDADRNWNAISLPFVVGPHGRIGKLNPTAPKR